MSEYRAVLERAGSNAPQPDLELERILRRRDRKRRNQRITAGLVGIAVFVAALWIVTSVGSLDRGETSVVPGGDVTGPAETGPTETGPTDTGWVEGMHPQYDLPPEGAVPSTPEEGELVDKYIDSGRSFVFVYADGRVITGGGNSDRINERRLTPEGVELVRSGAEPPENLLYSYTSGVPLPLWEDPELKPFVPSRYSVCIWRESEGDESAGSPLLRFFPAPARDILLRAETTHLPRELTCTPGVGPSYVVTTDEARALLDILGSMTSDFPTPRMVRIEDSEGVEIYWDIRMMLPDGPPSCLGCF